MTDFQKMQLELAITRIETKIDSYNRTKERSKKQAVTDDEYGYRETAQFSKGQEFTLEYVIDDLRIILQGLKAMQ